MDEKKNNNLIALPGMGQNFKDLAELQEFAQAQHKTIVNLSKKINNLEQENAHLKKLLESSAPLIKTDNSPVITEGLLTQDEEMICRMQLRKLREKSMTDELTLEESKRVEIFTKLLIQLQNKPQTINVNAKKMSDSELLAALSKMEEKENKDEQ